MIRGHNWNFSENHTLWWWSLPFRTSFTHCWALSCIIHIAAGQLPSGEVIAPSVFSACDTDLCPIPALPLPGRGTLIPNSAFDLFEAYLHAPLSHLKEMME
jgi:hypothetical protein